MKTAKMTQKQIHKLLGVSSSSFQKWLSNKDDPKHNLALIISVMDYEKTKELIDDIKMSKAIKSGAIIVTQGIDDLQK